MSAGCWNTVPAYHALCKDDTDAPPISILKSQHTTAYTQQATKATQEAAAGHTVSPAQLSNKATASPPEGVSIKAEHSVMNVGTKHIYSCNTSQQYQFLIFSHAHQHKSAPVSVAPSHPALQLLQANTPQQHTSTTAHTHWNCTRKSRMPPQAKADRQTRHHASAIHTAPCCAMPCCAVSPHFTPTVTLMFMAASSAARYLNT